MPLHDLVFVQIRSDIYVRCAQISHQFVESEEPVVEPDIVLYTQIADDLGEHVAIRFAFILPHARMGFAEHQIDHVRVFFEYLRHSLNYELDSLAAVYKAKGGQNLLVRNPQRSLDILRRDPVNIRHPVRNNSYLLGVDAVYILSGFAGRFLTITTSTSHIRPIS